MAEQRICCYLDLLGFSNFTKSKDPFEYCNVLENYAQVMRHKLDPFLTTHTYKSFESFIPFSDGIFITSSIENGDLFVQELSDFYTTCVRWNINENNFNQKSDDPFLHETFCLGTCKKLTRNHFPTLFRGGIAIGDVEYFSQKCIFPSFPSANVNDVPNVAGGGITAAVRMEETTGFSGGRILVSNDVVMLLSVDTRQKYILENTCIKDKDGTMKSIQAGELLWLNSLIETRNDKNLVFLEFVDFVNYFLRIYKYYDKNLPIDSRDRICSVYRETLKMIILAMDRFRDISGLKVSLKGYLKTQIQNDNMLQTLCNEAGLS
jgi:hypothetical protein